MTESPSKCYRHARWPLVKTTLGCSIWVLLGASLLLAPIGYIRWLGILPLSHGLFLWVFTLRPRWKHVVILNEEKLVIGKQSYDWEQFDLMQIGRNGSSRLIQLIGQNGKLNIEFKDDLPGFDELAQDCFFHMNRKVGGADTLAKHPKKVHNTL